METYHIYHEQSRQSETKLRRAEMQKAEHDAKRSSGSMSRRLLYLEKQTEKVGDSSSSEAQLIITSLTKVKYNDKLTDICQCLPVI